LYWDTAKSGHNEGVRIGLFGGTFDPPHAGHLALAIAGLEVAGFDEVWVIPANPVHRHLSGYASAAQRLLWIRQLFGEQKHIRILDRELNNEQPTAAIDTLSQLNNEHPQHEFWLMLGADAWRDFDTWRAYPAHRSLCNVAVFARAGITDLASHDGWTQTDEITRAGDAGYWCYLPVALPDISATELRRDAEQGIPLQGRVPTCILPAVTAAYQRRGGAPQSTQSYAE